MGDYQRDTQSLRLTDHGVYTLLLDSYYSDGGKIPTELDDLYVMCRAFEEFEKASVRKVADKFFPINGNGARHNKRADKELQSAGQAIEKMRESGKRGAAKRWGDDGVPHSPPYTNPNGEGNGVTIEPPTTIHQPPSTILHPPPAVIQPKPKVKNNTRPADAFIRPDDCPESAWRDWMTARKAKRLPNTETAWQAFKRECDAAGLTPADAVKVCAERGWGGFRASYMDGGAAGGKKTLLERNQEAMNQWLSKKQEEEEREIN